MRTRASVASICMHQCLQLAPSLQPTHLKTEPEMSQLPTARGGSSLQDLNCIIPSHLRHPFLLSVA